MSRSTLPRAGHLPDVLRKIKVNKTLKGILFDVDGTLAHSDDLHYKAFVDILQKEGFQGVGTTVNHVGPICEYGAGPHANTSRCQSQQLKHTGMPSLGKVSLSIQEGSR